MKKIILLISAIGLVACDANMSTTVKISELNSDYALSQAVLDVEVPACNDYKDSRLESKSLIRAKGEILKLFKKIDYKECYSKDMRSIASFTVPVIVGSNINKAPKELDADLSIMKSGNKVYVIAYKDFRENLASMNKRESSKMSFNVTISLFNDTSDIVNNISVSNKYVNNDPYYAANFSLSPNSKINLTLDDISSKILTRINSDENKHQGFAELATFGN